MRVTRVMWELARCDAEVWESPVRHFLTTSQGRDALYDAAANLLERCPELESIVPLPIAFGCDNFAFSFDGTKLACSLQEDGVTLILKPGSLLEEQQTPVSLARSGWVSFSPDLAWLLCGSFDRVEVFSCSSGELLGSMQLQGEYWWRVCVLRDGTMVSASNWSGTLAVWNPPWGAPWIARLFMTPSGSPRVTVASVDGSATALAASSTTPIFATGRLYGSIQIWSRDAHRLLSLSGHTKAINDLVFSSDGSRLVSASEDCTVRMWSPSSGDCIMVLHLGVSDVLFVSAALSDDDGLLAVATSSGARELGSVMFYRLPDGRLLDYSLSVAKPEGVRFRPTDTSLGVFIKSEGHLVRLQGPFKVDHDVASSFV